ncbi:hypothetical protein ACO34A_17190 [Rhizobium sp. ACO-34A]|nr:hypothetical protein ACO34A_17190 [Rhizobium sp. ACO-34A]
MAWIIVASADHVAGGVAGGFVQACHGKDAPLRRIQPGETVITYSSSAIFGQAVPLKAFTAIGTLLEKPPYRVEMMEGFHPSRRDVEWHASQPAPIRPLLDRLELTREKRNWGYVFRFGILRITEEDAAIIASAMNVGTTNAGTTPLSSEPRETLQLPLFGI